MTDRNFSFEKKPRNVTSRVRSAEASMLEDAGFPSRNRRKPGPLPGPRKVQFQSTVLPECFDEMRSECQRSGITRGDLVHKMWDFYKENHVDSKFE